LAPQKRRALQNDKSRDPSPKTGDRFSVRTFMKRGKTGERELSPEVHQIGGQRHQRDRIFELKGGFIPPSKKKKKIRKKKKKGF